MASIQEFEKVLDQSDTTVAAFQSKSPIQKIQHFLHSTPAAVPGWLSLATLLTRESRRETTLDLEVFEPACGRLVQRLHFTGRGAQAGVQANGGGLTVVLGDRAWGLKPMAGP